MFIELPSVPGAIGGAVSFGVSIVTSLLGALFSGIFGGASVGALQNAVLQLRDQLSEVADTLKRFAWQALVAIGKLLGMIRDLLANFLTLLWNFLKKLAATVWKLLQEALPKIIKALQNIRKFLLDLYAHYIRPILMYLQYIRRFLAILALFHVKFAAQLDAWLVNLQGRILAPFLYVMQTLNGFGNWINLILTAGLLIQRPVFLNSMYAYQRDWITMWWTGQAGAPGPTVAPPTATPGPPSQAQVTADLNAYTAADAGPYADVAAQAQQSAQAALAGL